ncbi:hypothetical protein HWV23_04365 [Natronomonas halophila]|uniref:DUF7550 family protein n=1 Tax=Natronomonas halophila TaxID=2747817 RepID=UPI0015B401FA|nr:hypothetical protein [Natronomonas halophila]QLD84983.1 hypothetical protein HWV23_04365 [Natronomonas halophila]
MTDHDDHVDEAEEGRTTAPQSDYSGRDVAIGAVVAVIGLLVIFGIPFLLA